MTKIAPALAYGLDRNNAPRCAQAVPLARKQHYSLAALARA